MFILWLGERITDKGVGNGISFIILVGIMEVCLSLFQEFVSRTSEKTGGLVMFLFDMLFLLLVIAGAILLVQGTRKVPVQYAKRIIGNKQYGGRQYIPLKVNAAGNAYHLRSGDHVYSISIVVQVSRKVPVQYAKRIIGMVVSGFWNAANVMPIIFAQAIMFIPISIVGFWNSLVS